MLATRGRWLVGSIRNQAGRLYRIRPSASRHVLEELGYRPLEAASADAALPILTSRRPLDLMISDVGLPGMNGRQLAEIAREHRPGLPILFVTGYAAHAAVRAGFLGTNMDMITKPFAIESLSAKIASMIAGPAT